MTNSGWDIETRIQSIAFSNIRPIPFSSNASSVDFEIVPIDFNLQDVGFTGAYYNPASSNPESKVKRMHGILKQIVS